MKIHVSPQKHHRHLCAAPWIFRSARNIVLQDIHLAGLTNSFLTLENASGTKLDEKNH